MSADKKLKIEDESRVFDKEWTVKYYFFSNVGNKVVCLLCHESVIVLKEYNLKSHNQTMHANFVQNFTSEERKRKSQELVNKLNQQKSVFTQKSTIQYAATTASFMVSYKLAQRNKPFSDSEFINQYISDLVNIMCPEQKTKMDSIALSSITAVRSFEKISDDLVSQLKDTSN
ncbi:unnamed protein product [Lepeophtheirus salmonis]|uniref:(salmon louse) hypothetical protein n=1 Tax=Lepeophtheirus salmonis TaxID=72036 RepID=A0A7R8CGZ1_LEPSM|nr:unnamed protein product [Lepeophtheirus salmonis]CAF2816011.1 unnamed protein product [Lepeophtheirus salmonis]